MWGRCLNAGQTCIAADYVLCHHTVAEAFAAACVEVLAEFFGSDGAKTEQNLSRIVAERHFDRLADMLKRVFILLHQRFVSVIFPPGSKGKVVAGGLDKSNRSTLIFAPTVVTGVQPGDSLLADEIFGE
jgi:aldehyde dehydrogenase (NAD+)